MRWLCTLIILTSIFAQKNDELLQAFHRAYDAQTLQKPYSTAILYKIFDMPYHEVQQHIFQTQLENAISQKYKNNYSSQYYNTTLTKKILRAQSAKDIPSKMRQAIKQEYILAVEVYGYERSAILRTFCNTTNTFSPIVKLSFVTHSDLVKKINDIMPQIFGLQGMLVAHNKELYLFFRGGAPFTKSILDKGDHTFYLFRNNVRIADTYVRSGELLSLSTYIYSKVDVLGAYKPRGFETAQKIYFTGGVQKIQLVDHQGQPQEGFSIFTSYEGFDDDQENYRGTTDISGRFELQDTQKAPIFLTIMKNINKVNFPIVRKHIIVENQKSPLKLVAQTLEEIQAMGKQQLSQRQLTRVKNEVVQRILQAKSYMKSADLEKAIISLEYAKNLTKKMKKEPSLKSALAKLENVYQAALRQKKANRNKKQCIALLKQTDEKVNEFQYTEALELAKKAQKLWPFPEEKNQGYQEIVKRIKKIEVLLLQENTRFGKARILLSRTVFTFNAQNITETKIEDIIQAVKILNEQEKHREIYNDRYVLLKSRSFLDKLAGELMEIANYHLQKYKSEENTNARREAYKNYEKHYNNSKKIDAILRELQKI
ncbi:hypothetical protein [Candidatus Uabimicrobium amorphum]|uniref:Uncharacterized protein n=1 Tax=Uabimicrobium amorphum TaxID=2596890 RepID=A0A5S9F2H3_UABAM|nr:hypothetical protein [Candidatus Uabimicrobium amorphum]BBM83677.1 hypothetical protein UABAM_02030 [Candidatus Uabimicrobium amorphum]